MLLSPSSAKKAPSTKRASAPPPARFATEMNASQPQSQPQRSRPRSNSNIQIPLFSPTSTQRPLPPLPLAVTSSSPYPTPSLLDQSIKVPVGDDTPVSSFPSSPYISNHDRLHPGANSPQPRSSHSPQLTSRQQLEDQSGGGKSSPVQPDPHLPSRQTFLRGDHGDSSISSTGSTGSAQQSNYAAQKKQKWDQVSSLSSKNHPRQDKHLDMDESSQNPSPTPTELSMNPHLNRLLGRDDNNRNGRQELEATDSVAAKHREIDSPIPNGVMSPYIPPPQFERGNAALPNSAATFSSSSSTQHHPLPQPDDSNPNSSQRIQNMTSPTFSTTSSYPSPAPFSARSPSLSSNDLQPYYPPPPTTSTTATSPTTIALTSTPQFSTQGSHPIPPRPRDTPTDTLSTTSLTSGKRVSPPEPQERGRRHSSAAGSLTIDTNSLLAIKKGPNTADIDTRTMANVPGGKTGNSSRYLEPDTVTKGTARKFLKSIGGSKSQHQQQQQRQSPSHLAIPQQQSSYHARQQGASPGHMTRSQQQLQQYQQQQYQGQGSRSNRETSPVSPSRAASSSNLLINLQDRTAMAMMQRYLTNPDDPDSEEDIATQVMISQAAVDSKGFEILMPEAVDGIKRVSHR